MEKKTLSQIPENWTWCKVSDAIDSITVTKYKIKKKSYQSEGPLPVIDQGADEIGGYTEDINKKVPCKLPVIIFGDHTRVFKYINYNFAAGADGIKVLKPKEFFNEKLLYYFLHCLKIPDKGYARHYQYLLREYVPIPPLAEQIRIIGRVEELFSPLDAGVLSLQAAQTQLEQYRRATLKQAYTGKLTQKWRQKYPTKIGLTAEEVDIEPYRNLITWDIPTEWKWASLGSLIETMQNGIYKPKKFYSDDGIACLRMYNIEDGKIVWKDIKRMILTKKEFNKFILKPNDILICRVSGSRALVGKSAVIPSNLEPCVYESKNIRMRLKQKDINSQYIQYWMLFFSSRYFNLNAQQVLMASISQKQIASMPIPITFRKEQNKIVEIVEEVYSSIDRINNLINKKLNLSKFFKNSILKRAFEGRLVLQDLHDEPASVLLDRINAQKVKQRKMK